MKIFSILVTFFPIFEARISYLATNRCTQAIDAARNSCSVLSLKGEFFIFLNTMCFEMLATFLK